MSGDKSPSQLIEERLSKMDEMGMYGDEMPYTHTCMDTGMMFETFGDAASYSPYTGSGNIMMMEGVAEQTPADFQKLTDIPASQKDQSQQTPLSPNPAPAQPGPASWQNQPWSPNPAPDAQAVIGATQSSVADRGFLPYPQQSIQPGQVPPYQTMSPNQKT